MSESPAPWPPRSSAYGPLGCLVVLVVALLCALILPGIRMLRNGPAHGRALALTAVSSLDSALKQYRAEYGTLPPAEHIMPALRGRNPRGIVFFDAQKQFFNARNEFIDPWGTPYRFDLSRPEAVRVWSCGPNRQDEGGAEGSDDIVNWRSTLN